jgi:hypothetical protein
MNKICTSIEQSKKLIELGIDINTADMRYGYIAPYDYSDRMYDGGYDEIPYPKDFLKKNPNFSVNEYDAELPCWSLAALLDVLPIVYTNNKKEICGPLHIDITDSETPFVLWYVNPLHKGCIVELKTRECDNLVDACYEMVLKLHELNLL